jgi:hypothetical protein
MSAAYNNVCRLVLHVWYGNANDFQGGMPRLLKTAVIFFCHGPGLKLRVKTIYSVNVCDSCWFVMGIRMLCWTLSTVSDMYVILRTMRDTLTTGQPYQTTLHNKIFSGDQPRQYWTAVQRFRGPLCLHHQGMMRWLSYACYFYTQYMPFPVRPLANGIEEQSSLRSFVQSSCAWRIQIRAAQ